MLKVYSKNGCPQCRMVKKYLSEHGVSFEEINISYDEEAKDFLLDHDIMSVPAVFKNATLFCTGFNINKLRELF